MSQTNPSKPTSKDRLVQELCPSLLFTSTAEALMGVLDSSQQQPWPRHVHHLLAPLDTLTTTSRLTQLYQEYTAQCHYVLYGLRCTIATVALLLPNITHIMSGILLYERRSGDQDALFRQVSMQFPQLMHCVLVFWILWCDIIRLSRASIPDSAHDLVPGLRKRLVQLSKQGSMTLMAMGQETGRLWCRWKILQGNEIRNPVDYIAKNQQSYITIYSHLRSTVRLLVNIVCCVNEAHGIAEFPPKALDHWPLFRNQPFTVEMEQEKPSERGPVNPTEPNQSPTTFQRDISFARPNKIYGAYHEHDIKNHENSEFPYEALQYKEIRKKPSGLILKLRPSKAAIKGLTQRVTSHVRKRFSRPASNGDIAPLLYHQPNPSTDTNLFSSYQTYLRHRKRHLPQTTTVDVPTSWPKRMWFKMKQGWQHCAGSPNSLAAHPADHSSGPDIINTLAQQLSLINLSLFPLPTGAGHPNGNIILTQTTHRYGNPTLSSESMYCLPNIFSYETVRHYRQKVGLLNRIDQPVVDNC